MKNIFESIHADAAQIGGLRPADDFAVGVPLPSEIRHYNGKTEISCFTDYAVWSTCCREPWIDNLSMEELVRRCRTRTALITDRTIDRKCRHCGKDVSATWLYEIPVQTDTACTGIEALNPQFAFLSCGMEYMAITDVDLLDMSFKGVLYTPMVDISLNADNGDEIRKMIEKGDLETLFDMRYTLHAVSGLQDIGPYPIRFCFDRDKGLTWGPLYADENEGPLHMWGDDRSQYFVLERMRCAEMSPKSRALMDELISRLDLSQRKSWLDDVVSVSDTALKMRREQAEKRRLNAFRPGQWLAEEADEDPDVFDRVYERFLVMNKDGNRQKQISNGYGLFFQKAPKNGILVSVVGVQHSQSADSTSPNRYNQHACTVERWYLGKSRRSRYIMPDSIHSHLKNDSTKPFNAGCLPDLYRPLFLQSPDEVREVFKGTFLEKTKILEYWAEPYTLDWMGSGRLESPLLARYSCKWVDQLLQEGRYVMLDSAMRQQSNFCLPKFKYDLPADLCREVELLMETDGVTDDDIGRLAEFMCQDYRQRSHPRSVSSFSACITRLVMQAFGLTLSELLDYLQEQKNMHERQPMETVFADFRKIWETVFLSPDYCGIRTLPADLKREAGSVAEFACGELTSKWPWQAYEGLRRTFDECCRTQGTMRVGQPKTQDEVVACGYRMGYALWKCCASKWLSGGKHLCLIVKDADNVPRAMAIVSEDNLLAPEWTCDEGRDALLAYAADSGLHVFSEDEMLEHLPEEAQKELDTSYHALMGNAIKKGWVDPDKTIDEKVTRKNIALHLVHGGWQMNVMNNRKLLVCV